MALPFPAPALRGHGAFSVVPSRTAVQRDFFLCGCGVTLTWQGEKYGVSVTLWVSDPLDSKLSGWVLLQQCPWSHYQSWILPLYTEMCVDLLLYMSLATDATLANIHLRQNNCERGLLGGWSQILRRYCEHLWGSPLALLAHTHWWAPVWSLHIGLVSVFCNTSVYWCAVSTFLLWMMMLNAQPCLGPSNHLTVTLLLAFNKHPGYFSSFLIFKTTCGFNVRAFCRQSASSRDDHLL